MNGTPVEDADDRRALADATETVHQTRTDLRFGRGNIATDVRASRGESTARSAAACLMLHHGGDVQAGVSLALGAGNCDQNGMINARRHAAKMEPGGTTRTVSSPQYHHTYAIYDPPPKPQTTQSQEPRPTVVLDSWANGPAVRLQDALWTDAVQTTEVYEIFDKASGTEANEAMEKARADATYTGLFGKRTQLYAESRGYVKQYRANNPNFDTFASSSIVSPAFAAQAHQNLFTKKPLEQEILAAGAARQSYNLSVAEATKQGTIDRILEETANLKAQTRPPIASR